MTRGIRVETAAIIIITLFGIISQLKVWKIIKRKREERAAETRKKEQERDLSDEEQGRKVESGNRQDRPLWEALHGNKNNAKVQGQYLDSGLGTEEPSSTRQSSIGNTRISNDEGMELHDMQDSANGSHKGGRLTVHVGQDFFCEVPTIGGPRNSGDRDGMGSNSIASKPAVSVASSVKETARNSPKVLDPGLTLQPKVVPPPFRIPDLDSASDDDGSLIEASAPTEHLPDRRSKRFSGTSMTRRLSKRSQISYVASGTSEEALMVPHIEDDRASSLAATVDGVSGQGEDDKVLNYSRSHTPIIENILDGASLEALEAANHNKSQSMLVSALENTKEADPESHRPASVALPTSRPVSVAEEGSGLDGLQHKPSEASKATSETSEQRKERFRLSGNLPEGGSKVVTAYRTNEWAKHLESAEAPLWDNPKADVQHNQQRLPKGEAAAPLDVKALQQTPLSAEPAPAPTSSNVKTSLADLPSSKPRSSHLMSRNPFSRHSKQQKQPPKQQPVLHPLTIAKNNERTPSQSSLVASRTSSQTSLNSNGENHRPQAPRLRSSQVSLPGLNRGQRSSSTPLASPLVEAPIEEGVESSFPKTASPPTIPT